MIQTKQLEQFLTERGHKSYRIKQIYQAVHRHLVASFADITDIPQDLRQELSAHFAFSTVEKKILLESQDGTRKVLFETADHHFIEGVLLSHDHGYTVCLSTQVGCAMNCDFCATGKLGLKRHLSTAEMVDQVLFFARLVRTEDRRIDNVVLMWMGEPFHNYTAVMDALECLNDPHGLAIGQRHLTISTCGLAQEIRRFTTEGKQYNLAISLHAPTQALRESFMPIAKRYPLDELLSAIREYQQTTNRRIFYEYTLLSGVNDSDEQAHLLGKLLQPQLPLAHVNLLLWNGNEQSPYKRPTEQRLRQFQSILALYNVPSTFRHSRGDDISAACGQLANKVS